MHQELSARFPGAEVFSFPWSGSNSHASRLEAAKELQKYFVRAAEGRPGLRHFVIAHSHGGNVTIYALRGLSRETRRTVRGVACIANPFIQCRGRDVSTQRLRLLASGVAGTILWTIVCASSLFPHSLRIAAGALAGVGVIALYQLFRVLPIQALNLFTQTHTDRLHADPPGQVPLLCVRTGRDEAQIWLDIVSIICRAMTWLWDQAFTLFVRWIVAAWVLPRDIIREKSQEWWNEQTQKTPPGCLIVLLIVYSPFLLLIAGIAAAIALFPVMFFGTVAFYAVIIMALIALMLPHVIAVATWLTRASPWGFGEHWLINWFIDIRATGVPRPTIDSVATDTGWTTLKIMIGGYSLDSGNHNL